MEKLQFEKQNNPKQNQENAVLVLTYSSDILLAIYILQFIIMLLKTFVVLEMKIYTHIQVVSLCFFYLFMFRLIY